MLGTFVKSPDATSAEVLAGAGLDFLIVDLDHSSLGFRDLEGIARAAALHGVPVLARLPPDAVADAGRVLDAGATGVQIADLSSVELAESARRHAAYPPGGERSLALSHRAAEFGRLPASDYLRRAADELVLVGQIESAAAVDALPGLLAAGTGIDAWFLGPLDLSVSLGRAGENDDPLVVETLDRAAAAIVAAKAPLGVFTGSIEEALRWRERGATLIAVGSDYTLLGGLAGGLARSFRGS